MKALIIDPALHSMGGHHYNAVQRLQDELRMLGLDAPCLGSAYADRRVIDELACTPVFTKSVYGRTYAAPAEFTESVEETGRELSQAMGRQGAAPDLIILPCCDQVLAAALARHLKRARLAARPHLLLWLLYGPHPLKATDDPGIAGLAAECRDAFGALAAAAGERRWMKAYCETPELAGFYGGLIDLDVGVLRAPGLVAAPRAARPSSGRPPTVSCIGFANRPKGYRLLPGAVGHVLQNHAEARFMIHGVVAGSDAESDQPLFDQLAGRERVVVGQEVLSSPAYLSRLAQTDLLLLPYDPSVYRSRGSGVFSDARTIGIPIVAPRECAFARPAFDEGWGVAIEDYSPQGLGLAIMQALDGLDDLCARAAHTARGAYDDLDQVLRMTIDEANSGKRGIAGAFRRWAARFA